MLAPVWAPQLALILGSPGLLCGPRRFFNLRWSLGSLQRLGNLPEPFCLGGFAPVRAFQITAEFGHFRAPFNRLLQRNGAEPVSVEMVELPAVVTDRLVAVRAYVLLDDVERFEKIPAVAGNAKSGLNRRWHKLEMLEPDWADGMAVAMKSCWSLFTGFSR
jgi:hypothetical protein